MPNGLKATKTKRKNKSNWEKVVDMAKKGTRVSLAVGTGGISELLRKKKKVYKNKKGETIMRTE